MVLANVEEAPTRLDEGLLLCAFAALYPQWTTSSALKTFMETRLACNISGAQVRNALQRAMNNCLFERRPAVDPALKVNGPRRGPRVIFEYRLSAEGVAIFNRRERERALIIGYEPILVPVPRNEYG
jgi:hypothetical protein